MTSMPQITGGTDRWIAVALTAPSNTTTVLCLDGGPGYANSDYHNEGAGWVHFNWDRNLDIRAV